jgi:dTDP-4-dehydrorhamnose reductase
MRTQLAELSSASGRDDVRRAPATTLELWGGHECTVNRVGDRWFDQTIWSGHQDRVSDLDLFAGLGLKALRYPALWERISPRRPDERDFAWTDERLPRIRDLGMQPIVTLCHHGSGPHYTNLLREDFAAGLAGHAQAVAERYPWVRDWTPVNEPLTTARFSALYGYWYPHTTDETAFWTALLNEIDATRLAMREIRRLNPQARLIQTDDLGYCHATAPLRSEAAYQNERRWAGWDLLCGMVVPGHPLWSRIAASGLEDRLRRIADDPCPPDVIGVNHYLASERLLDHRLERHRDRALADRALGDLNGVPFVDVDAIRSHEEGVLGFGAILQQAWERYGRTLAITECHNGATREEQARWFVDTWRTAEDLRAAGVDLCAVTAWSLLGSHDWNRMVTRPVGHYEVGVYDVRLGAPKPTMMAEVLPQLAAGSAPRGVGLTQPGWWRREGRIRGSASARARDPGREPPLMLVGRAGRLGGLFIQACRARRLPYIRTPTVTPDALLASRPWAVVNISDWAGVCQHLDSPRRLSLADFSPPEAMVRACAEAGIPCAVISARDQFADVHDHLLSLGRDRLLIALTDQVFGAGDGAAFAAACLDRFDFGLPVAADRHAAWGETYGPDLVDAILDLLLDGAGGALTFSTAEGWSDADLVQRLAEIAEADPQLTPVPPAAAASPSWPAQRVPVLLPPPDSMLERLVRERRRWRQENVGLAAEGRRGSAAPLELRPSGKVA